MYGKLPIEITSVHGFEGCLANIAVNGEALDPVESALIPSPLVSEGCKGEIFLLLNTLSPELDRLATIRSLRVIS